MNLNRRSLAQLGGKLFCTAGALFAVACNADYQTVDSAQEAAAPRIALSTEGVGGLNAKTPFTVEAIRHAFPHQRIVEETRTTEGEAYPVIAVQEDKQTFLRVNPNQGKVGSVIILSNKITNSFGDDIGNSFARVFESTSTTNCLPGYEELSGSVLCTAPEANNITYVFEGRWNGPDSELPPGDILEQWNLAQIIWMPATHRNQLQTPDENHTNPLPSFECGKPSGKVEELICTNPQLAALDRDLARAYQLALEKFDETRREQLRALQRGWIKGRNDCWKAIQVSVGHCVAASYRARIKELKTWH